MSGTTRIGRLAAIARVTACLTMVGACTPSRPPTFLESEADAADFRELLLENDQVVKGYIQRTRSGENLSEMSLGWLVMSVLVNVSSEDRQLYAHFNADGRDVEEYLETTFSEHPEQEIGALDAMVAQHRSALCPIARSALEALRHIPDGSEPANVQKRDRDQLMAALVKLDAQLQKAANHVVASGIK